MTTDLQQHTTLVIGLIALMISVFELLRSGQKILKIGWNGWRNIILTLGAKHRTPIDVSSLLIPPPLIAQKNIEDLKSLGFRRLGEAQIRSLLNPPGTAWVFVHPETGIQAEVAWKRVAFSTYFQENVLVTTDFPNGEHIEIPNYQSHTITTSVSDAYDYHLQQVEKFSRKYGRPHPIRTMSDYLKWEKVGRKNYATLKLSRWIWNDVVRLIAFIYGCFVLILIPLYFHLQGMYLPNKIWIFSSLEIPIYLSVLLLLPAILVPRYFNRWIEKQTHKDSRQQKRQK